MTTDAERLTSIKEQLSDGIALFFRDDVKWLITMYETEHAMRCTFSASLTRANRELAEVRVELDEAYKDGLAENGRVIELLHENDELRARVPEVVDVEKIHDDMCDCDRCAPRCEHCGGKLQPVRPGKWQCAECE